ncbi:hypothetical protein GCM10009132_06770 [Serratia ureilytica]
MSFLVVNQPALAPQQDMDPLHTITNAGFCNLPYPLREGPIIAAAAVVIDRSALHHQPASPANPDAVRSQQIVDHLAFLHRPQNFFG